MNILIVDDDPVIREILLEFLKQADYEVTTATTGQEALEEFRQQPYDILISDWMMPELDGLQLTRAIRKMELRSYCYIILLTGQEGHRNRMTAMNAGVDAFLPKPFDSDAMEMQLTVANRIVGYHQHIQRLESLVPICCYCKRIQGKDEEWQGLQDYVEANGKSLFKDALCPNCLSTRVNTDLVPPDLLKPDEG